MSKVVNVNLDPYDVSIGTVKDFPYDNPKRIFNRFKPCGENVQEVKDYEEYLLRNRQLILKMKAELQNKVLGCYCAPKGGIGPDDKDAKGNYYCHGQFILKAVRGDYG